MGYLKNITCFPLINKEQTTKKFPLCRNGITLKTNIFFFVKCRTIHDMKAQTKMILIKERRLLLIKLFLDELVLGYHLHFTPGTSPPLWYMAASGTSSSLKCNSFWEFFICTPGQMYARFAFPNRIQNLGSTSLSLLKCWSRLAYVRFLDYIIDQTL